MGVTQRALLTLPFGLMIGRSSIPSAGIGVLNYGPTVSPGMHFGPYEGEVTTREIAIASDFSWEVSWNILNPNSKRFKLLDVFFVVCVGFVTLF